MKKKKKKLSHSSHTGIRDPSLFWNRKTLSQIETHERFLLWIHISYISHSNEIVLLWTSETLIKNRIQTHILDRISKWLVPYIHNGNWFRCDSFELKFLFILVFEFSVCSFSISQSFESSDNSSAIEPKKSVKMSLQIFVAISLQIILVEHLITVDCNSFNHTAGSRSPFGISLFSKVSIFQSKRKIKLNFSKTDLLHEGDLFQRVTTDPRNYSIAFKYHAHSFSGPPFFVQLNVKGAQVKCFFSEVFN